MKRGARQAGPLLTALLLALITSGWAIYRAVHAPATETVETNVQVEEFTVWVRFEYVVEITEETLLWPAGTLLQPGRPLYSYAGSPLLHITPVVEVLPGQMEDFAGLQQVRVELRALNYGGETVWTHPAVSPVEEPFQSVTGESVKHHGSVLTLPVSDLRRQIQRINEENGFQQVNNRITVLTRVQVEGRAGDRFELATVNGTLPFHLDTQGFFVPPLEKQAASHTVEYTRTDRVEIMVPVSRRLQAEWPVASIGLTSLILSLIVETVRRRREASTKREPDPEHRRLKSWITEGQVRTNGAHTIDVYSLEGLVDVAIDMKKRVIYDRTRHNYHVIDEGIVYSYCPEQERALQPRAGPLLGEILLKSGAIDQRELEQALGHQGLSGRPLGECLVVQGLVDEVTLYTALAEQAGMPYMEPDLAGGDLDPGWLDRLSAARAHVFGAVPLGRRPDGKIAVAIAKPDDTVSLTAIADLLGHGVEAVLARPSMIGQAIEAVRGRAALQKLGGLQGDTLCASSQAVPSDRRRRDLRLLREYARRGQLPLVLTLKAAGFLRSDSAAPERGPDKAIWRALVQRGEVHPDALQLAMGARRLFSQSWRSGSKALSLYDLLHVSGRLPPLLQDWGRRQSEMTPDELLIRYFLASSVTVARAGRLMAVLSALEVQ